MSVALARCGVAVQSGCFESCTGGTGSVCWWCWYLDANGDRLDRGRGLDMRMSANFVEGSDLKAGTRSRRSIPGSCSAPHFAVHVSTERLRSCCYLCRIPTERSLTIPAASQPRAPTLQACVGRVRCSSELPSTLLGLADVSRSRTRPADQGRRERLAGRCPSA